jgi:hypothetical protein
MDDGFDLATQLLLFNPTAVDNGNDSVTSGKCPFPTNRQRSPSSCGDPTLDCDGPNEGEDDYVFDVIATDDDEDARPSKRRRLLAISCRYPRPASTVSELQEDGTD